MKRIVLLSVILLLIQNVNVNGQIMFSKTITAGINTMGKSIVQTSDGSYVIAGTIRSTTTDSNDVYLVKTSSTGSVLWSKKYGGTGDEKTDKIEKTTDGGFVISGLTNSFGAGGYDVYVIKTDSLGNTLWTKAYGGLNDEGNISFQNEPYLSFIKQTNDGGYIISSATKSFGNGQAIYVIKTNANGDTTWTRTFSNTQCLGGAILQTADGGYIISASTNDTSHISEHFYIQCLIKLNALGNMQWTKGIAGDYCAASNAFNGNSVFTTADGGYALIGNSYDGSCEGNTYYLIKVDSSGNWVWSKDYFHGDYAMTFAGDACETSDGSFIIPSMSFFVDTINGVSYKAILHKIDNSGNEIWAKVYGGYEDNDAVYQVKQTTDGGFVLVGYSYGNTYILKTDSLGNSGCYEFAPHGGEASVAPNIMINPVLIQGSGGIVNSPTTIVSSATSIDNDFCSLSSINEINVLEEYITLFPNPTSSTFTITSTEKIESIKLYNIVGELLITETPNSNQSTININQFSKGIYFAEIKTEKGIMRKKVVRE